MADPRDEKLRAQIAHAYENAPAVRRRFDEAGLTAADIQRVADLVKLPVQPKDSLIAQQQADPPFGGLLAVPPNEVRHIFFSPGPLYEPDAGDDASLMQTTLEALEMVGFAAGDIVLNTFSYHLVPAGLLFDDALVRHGCTVVPGGVGNSDLQLKMMMDLKVTGYAGTPSFLMSLIEKAEAQGLDFNAAVPLKRAFFSAEPLFSDMRRRFEEGYGLTVGNAYATAELGVLALDATGNNRMQLFAEPIVEVVDPQTGQPVAPGTPGEVVVTNFSRAYPLIRLGTGDMAMNWDPNPGQSRQAERAITLVGRSGEAVKVRGMFVHPNQLRFAVSQIAGISGVQGVVTRPEHRDVLTIRVAVADPAAAGDALAEQVRQAIQAVSRVKVDAVEFVSEIPAGERGMVDAREWR